MSYSCSSIVELVALIVGIGAWISSVTTTVMPNWLTLSPELMELLEINEIGLWESCVVMDVVGTECHPIKVRRGLPPNLKLARICMCISNVLGILSILIAVPGLKLVKIGGGSEGRQVKRGMKITAGVLGLMAAILVLYPVSLIGYETTVDFNAETVPDSGPRWEFGNALFIGWAAGFFHVVSAMLFFASSCGAEEKKMLLKLLSKIKK